MYDETRALVCDMYLQRADKVNAGDELEFEHHLVTVEEFKGTVVQDLNAIISPILERRQAVASHLSTATPIPRKRDEVTDIDARLPAVNWTGGAPPSIASPDWRSRRCRACQLD